MKYRNLLWVIVVSVLFVSCRYKEYPHESGIVFYNEMTSSVWIGSQKVDLQPMRQYEERETYIDLFFDSEAGKLWAWNLTKDNSTLYLADITDGKYNPQKELTIPTFEGRQAVSVCAYNDTAIIEYLWSEYHYPGLFGLVDLPTDEQTICDIRYVIENLRHHCFFTRGYDGKQIFFENGWYDIEKKSYYEYPDSWNNDYYPALYAPLVLEVNKRAGTIREYNVETCSYADNDIVLNKLLSVKWRRLYSEPHRLFIAVPSPRWQLNFLSGPPARAWYKYDTENGSLTQIYSPDKRALILGRIKQKRL